MSARLCLVKESTFGGYCGGVPGFLTDFPPRQSRNGHSRGPNDGVAVRGDGVLRRPESVVASTDDAARKASGLIVQLVHALEAAQLPVDPQYYYIPPAAVRGRQTVQILKLLRHDGLYYFEARKQYFSPERVGTDVYASGWLSMWPPATIMSVRADITDLDYKAVPMYDPLGVVSIGERSVWVLYKHA